MSTWRRNIGASYDGSTGSRPPRRGSSYGLQPVPQPRPRQLITRDCNCNVPFWYTNNDVARAPKQQKPASRPAPSRPVPPCPAPSRPADGDMSRTIPCTVFRKCRKLLLDIVPTVYVVLVTKRYFYTAGAQRNFYQRNIFWALYG